MNPPELSVVMLGYRAGRNLYKSVPHMISLLEKNVQQYELILVANYDTAADDTPEVAKKLATKNSHIRITVQQKQGMYGWDVRSGLSLAQGNYIAYVDGDGQVLFEDIVRAYETAKTTGSELVVAYRTKRGDTAWRSCISFIFNILLRLFFPKVRTKDVNAKPKLFTRRALKMLDLKSSDWFIDAELTIKAHQMNLTISEIPTTFYPLEGRKSFVKPFTIFEFLRNLVLFRCFGHVR